LRLPLPGRHSKKMNKQCPLCGRHIPEYLDGREVGPICSICYWDREGSKGRELNFITVDTIRLPQSGNVSKARIEMVKRRALHPDGSGEVVLKSETGKITSRSADDY